jgi:hypothetical protein
VFIDPETGARLTVNPQEVARGYRERVEAFLERQRQRCLDASVRYGRVELGEESLEPLLTFLEGAWV